MCISVNDECYTYLTFVLFLIFQKHQKISAKKKLKRHDLSTNKEFLKSIPKTEFAKVI